MELFLTIIIIFIVVGWIFGKLFPKLLLWYITKKAKNFNGGQNGGFSSFGGFNNAGGFNGFAGFNANANSTADDHIKRSKEQEGTAPVSRMVRQEKVIESTRGESIEYESVTEMEDKNREVN